MNYFIDYFKFFSLMFSFNFKPNKYQCFSHDVYLKLNFCGGSFFFQDFFMIMIIIIIIMIMIMIIMIMIMIVIMIMITWISKFQLYFINIVKYLSLKNY